MAKRGAPVTVYTEERIQEIKALIDLYTDESAIPILAEFCYTNNIRKQRLYEIPELTDSIKKMMEKKEAQLEKGALGGKINTSVAIFSLKQLGWRDKVEISGDKENPLELKINRVIVEPGEITDLGELEKDG